MSGVWLNGQPGQLPALRTVLLSAGLAVAELPNYDYRFRSRGGSNSLGFPAPGPWGIVVHHTASCLACWSADFPKLCLTHSAAPVSNTNLGMSNGVPTFGLVAAGSANTNGSGGPWTFSKGLLPASGGVGSANVGNGYLIGIECSINGTGEVWPKVMTDALIAGVAAMCKAYNLDPLLDVLGHDEWDTDGTKIDPAGPTEDKTLGVHSGPPGATWNMNPFRQRVAQAMNPQPPITSGDDMVLIKGNSANTGGSAGAVFPYPGNGTAQWLPAALPRGYVFVHVNDGNFATAMGAAGELRVIDQAACDKVPKATWDEYATFLGNCAKTTDTSQLATKADIAGVNANIDAIPGGSGGGSGPFDVTLAGTLNLHDETVALTGTAKPPSG